MEIESEATRSCDLDVKELAIENDTPTDDVLMTVFSKSSVCSNFSEKSTHT